VSTVPGSAARGGVGALVPGPPPAAGARIGLFGGSFDPIHQGHLAPVEAARAELGLERVIYLPTAIPPHKPRRGLAAPHARYAMVELALLGRPGLYASPLELTPGVPAFTADSVARFRGALPGCELYLLIGSDSFGELHRWMRWREIVAAARLVVLTRPGWEVDPAALPPEPGALASAADVADGAGEPRVHLLHSRPVEASSTRLRELLAQGEEPPPGWVPQLVVDYIRKYDLYR
jgi:nicotinate-nucleotide adenylyltransferase